MSTHDLEKNDLTLSDLWNLIKLYKIPLIVTPLITGLIGFVLVSRKPPIWEGSMVIEPGQVNLTLFEIAPQIIARTWNPTLGRQVFEKLQPKPENFAETMALYQSSLSGVPVVNTNMVSISVRGYSPEMTKTLLKATSERIQEMHAEMQATAEAPLRENLKYISEKVQRARVSVFALQKVVDKMPGLDTAEKILAMHFLKNEEREELTLEQQKKNLQDQLSEPRTFATRLFSEITVTDHPVAPNKKRYVMFSIFAGFFTAIAFSLIHYLIKREKN